MVSAQLSGPKANSAALAEQCGWERVNERGYEILERPYGVHAAKRLIVIGAGATGLTIAKLAEAIPNLDVQIYDKNEEVGGTWWENRYPGCACDIPAHIYQFQWALNPNWSHYYVGATEILQYIQKAVDDHGLRKYIKLQHKAVKASWDSASAKWTVEIETPKGNIIKDECDFLLNAAGLLNNWRWPDIKGIDTFKGSLAHSAHYDTTLDLKNKKVAVVGSGSSGVQIVAAIQPTVEHLYTWVRSPLWVGGGFATKYAAPGGENFAYSEKLKEHFKSDPKALLRYVKMLESELGKRFDLNLTNSPEAKEAIVFSRQSMEEKLGDRKDLVETIIPTTYGIGCRRPTPGSGYLEALVAKNVTAYTQSITEITPKGFIDPEGVEHEVDVIICATGFDTSFVPRFPVLANGKDLRDEWETDPVSYFSVMVPNYPNYFLSLGPYSASNGSLMPAIEHGCYYILEVIKKAQVERIRSIAPKADATNDFREHADLLLKRTAWTQPCRSWFKGGTIDGLPRNYPGSRAHFVEIMQPRYEDFEITYERDNRYYFMGNGFSVRELDGRDTTWFLGIVDGKDEEPDYTQDEELVASLSEIPK